MNNLINFNGNLVDAQTPVATVSNRSLRYGDGIFETMFWNGKQIANLSFHLDRLFQGLSVLKFDLSAGFSREIIEKEIGKICLKNAPASKARVRLNVFREDGSVLFPTVNRPVFIIETTDIPEEPGLPLRLIMYRDEQKSMGPLSNLKTNNYLLNIMALQFAREQGSDDVVLLNSRGNICEASSSNLFMVQKGIIFTPSLTEACVAGTKRRELIGRFSSLGFPVQETSISPDRLPDMEEVFLSNAIRFIRSVKSIDGKIYTQAFTEELVRLLQNDKS